MPEPTDPAGAALPDDELDTLPQIADRVIALLTRAARMQRPTRPFDAPGAAAADVPAPEPIDFADFVVPVLAAVAANRGGVDALLAGRPGSWEAAKLGDLLISAGCENPQRLADFRTEPIVIDVPLERILLDAGEVVFDPDQPDRTVWRPLQDPTQTYDDQRNDLECRADDTYTEITAQVAAELGRPTDDQAVLEEAGNRFTQVSDQIDREIDAELAALRARWTARYTRYLDAFRLQVAARATETGLDRIPIQVRGVTDPDQAWDASRDVPDLWETDPLAAQLYQYAVEHTPASLLITDTPQGDAP